MQREFPLGTMRLPMQIAGHKSALGGEMSVLVIATMKADKAAFERLIAERGDEMKAISSRGKAAGAIHHRFGMSDDGTVIIIDEWNNAEAFQKFFSDPE